MRLAQLFLAHLQSGPHTPPATAELEAALAALIDAGRQAWPALPVSDELFLRQLASGLPATDLTDSLAEVHASDLFLACGCLLGDTRALAELDAHFLVQISEQLTRHEGAVAAGDVLQELRTRVLVAREDAAPRIAGYHGRGPLMGWLRVAAARVSVDLARARRPDSVRRDDPVQLRSPSPDPELELLKRRYRHEFEEAFRATLAGLPARDANVLRLHYLEEVPTQQIGAIYGVTARSVQLWLAQARRTILLRTRRLLANRLRVSTSQLDGLMNLVQSQLDVSLHKLLEKPEQAPRPKSRG
jgi:RNA polymerase sigma-70 factor (ECF subfamily)